MSWYLAKSLETLRNQVNAQWPKRDKSSDGTIGDAAHAVTKSEHNPDPSGAVRAWDCDKDLSSNVTVKVLVDALVAGRDPRILYIIWNGRMIRSYAKTGIPAWTWSTYTGKNAHKEHMHISVVESQALYNSTRPWNLAGMSTTPQEAQHDVRWLQAKLGVIADGQVGPKTIEAMIKYVEKKE